MIIVMLNLIQYRVLVGEKLNPVTDYRRYFTYVMSNDQKTLYVGVTGNLYRRVWEHKRGIGSKFANKHRLTKLVWFEETDQVQVAIGREKQLKRWRRNWKLELMESSNPSWADLATDWYQVGLDTESSSA